MGTSEEGNKDATACTNPFHICSVCQNARYVDRPQTYRSVGSSDPDFRRRLVSEAAVSYDDWGSRKALPARPRRRLEELTGYPTISRILREEERSRRTSNLPPR